MQLAFTVECGPCLLEFAQALFPLRFQSAGYKPVLRIHGTIATLGALCLVAGPFDGQPPLCEGCVVVGFELPCRLKCRLEGGRLECFKKSVCDGLVDLHAADVQAEDAAAIDDILAGAVVTGTCVSSRVLGA